ncbi:MAG: AbrB/MazE/SpoVT family DNA-binding domain-containing protein [Firmicutes bacterium]|nr:AbrB/MazE/SpoVT family DNA-binding domain-containing protein [Bacillota bacterium]
MQPDILKVRVKGQITIPTKIRRQMGIEEGDYLTLEKKEDGLILRKLQAYKRASFEDGIWKLIGTAEDKEGKTDLSTNKHRYLGEKL